MTQNEKIPVNKNTSGMQKIPEKIIPVFLKSPGISQNPGSQNRGNFGFTTSWKITMMSSKKPGFPKRLKIEPLVKNVVFGHRSYVTMTL